jgi:exopolyphosphatase/pppGpp-phosphohydrolase
MPRVPHLADYVREVGAPCVAVFDIGTRASRLLVAPKNVPVTELSRRAFFNDSDLSQLGADVDKYNEILPIGESRALERVVSFMQTYTRALPRMGIPPEDTLAIGTAVFRWLKNQAEVLAYLRERTGVSIKVIPDQFEALVSLAGINLSRKWRPGGPAIGKDDRIVLLDQGGGSMEVSYVSPDTSQFKVHSFDRLGTIALRNRFLTTDHNGKRVSPETNRSRIKAQTERVAQEIETAIRDWEGYPELGGRTLHAYAMGSAITDSCYRNLSNYEIHNRVCTVARMLEVVEQTCSKFETSNQTVLSVYKALEGIKGKGTAAFENVESDLLTLYGMPVYVQILRRFGLDEVRACGYGLRYGYYVWKHHYHLPDELGAPAAEAPAPAAAAAPEPAAAAPPAAASDGAVSLAAEAEGLLKEIETSVAEYVLTTLKGSTQGNWWYERVPENLRGTCVLRREQEKGKHPSEAYFDLIDFKVLIESNWPHFEAAFQAAGYKRGKKDALAWLDRVNELRKVRAHPVRQFVSGESFSRDDVDFLRDKVVLLGRLKDAATKPAAP